MIKHKDESFKRFNQWYTPVLTQIGKKLKRLRTDNGLVFGSKELDEFCSNHGIVRYYTVAHTPQPTGLAERN